jgi:hypothetical protein
MQFRARLKYSGSASRERHNTRRHGAERAVHRFEAGAGFETERSEVPDVKSG